MTDSLLTKRTMRMIQTIKIFKYFYFMVILETFLLKIRIKPGKVRLIKIMFNLLSIIMIFSCKNVLFFKVCSKRLHL